MTIIKYQPTIMHPDDDGAWLGDVRRNIDVAVDMASRRVHFVGKRQRLGDNCHGADFKALQVSSGMNVVSSSL